MCETGNKEERQSSRLVVFDFDRTMIDHNSDTWIVEKLCPELVSVQKRRVKEQMQWTDIMDEMMSSMALKKINVDALRACLSTIPMADEMKQILQLIKRRCVDLSQVKVLSDANVFFIDEVLRAHGVRGLVDEIVSNPVLEEPRTDNGIIALRVIRFIRPPARHACPICPLNLCKGDVISAHLGQGIYDRVIFVGDGMNDFCAALKLRSTDVLFARKHFGLEKLLLHNPGKVRCPVFFWSSHADLLLLFQEHLH